MWQLSPNEIRSVHVSPLYLRNNAGPSKGQLSPGVFKGLFTSWLVRTIGLPERNPGTERLVGPPAGS